MQRKSGRAPCRVRLCPVIAPHNSFYFFTARYDDRQRCQNGISSRISSPCRILLRSRFRHLREPASERARQESRFSYNNRIKWKKDMWWNKSRAVLRWHESRVFTSCTFSSTNLESVLRSAGVFSGIYAIFSSFSSSLNNRTVKFFYWIAFLLRDMVNKIIKK